MCSRRSPWNGSRIVLMNWRGASRHSRTTYDQAHLRPHWRGRSTNAMSRSQIDRLTRRIEALAQRKPPEQRIFTVLVRNHMRTDEEIARFCAEHGVTDSDLLIAQILVPFETRRAKPQKMPTNASCAPWRETMTMGAKAKRRCLAATHKLQKYRQRRRRRGRGEGEGAAEHVARHPEDAGRTVEDFNWILQVIVRPAA